MPRTVAANPTNEEMLASFDELYGGVRPGGRQRDHDPHWCATTRKWSDPFSYNYCYPGMPKINNEPRGPGSSAGGMYTDATVVYSDLTKTIQAGWTMYMGHSEWSVWNGHLPVEYHNGWREIRFLWELPHMPAIAQVMKSIGAGVDPGVPGVPPGQVGEEPMKPREQFYAEFADVDAFYADHLGLQRPGGMVKDWETPVAADSEAMAAWGYDLMAGQTPDQVKHAICQSDEWQQKHPGETPPF